MDRERQREASNLEELWQTFQRVGFKRAILIVQIQPVWVQPSLLQQDGYSDRFSDHLQWLTVLTG